MRNQRGLSLVELMISITLGLVLMAGVVQMFMSSNLVFKTQQGLSRIQETGRLAVEFVGRDLRMASYSGCGNTNSERIEDPLTSLTGLHRNFTEGLRGYSISTSGTTDLPNGITSGIATDLGTTFTVTINSDILVIRGANERGMAVTNVNTDAVVYGYSNQTVTNGCIEGFCNGGIAIISNCRNGRVFQLSVNPTITSNEVTLTHADLWDVISTTDDVYERDISTITPIHTVVYFVATSLTNPTPSLWQKIDNGNAIEILQGVERLGLQYMEKPSDVVPIPSYQLANSGTAWGNVSAVQAEFVVRGDNPLELDAPQPYSFRGTTITPTDRFMRKVFRTTFSLRSRNP